MTKVNREWELNYEEKVFRFITGMLGQYGKPLNELTELQKSMLEIDCRKLTASVIHEISQDYFSQTRNDLLRELLEEMPKKKSIVGIPTEPEGNLVQDMINLRSLSQVESFNEALDQVNTLLESKLSTVKK